MAEAAHRHKTRVHQSQAAQPRLACTPSQSPEAEKAHAKAGGKKGEPREKLGCDMCTKYRQAKCEYPQESHYGGFSNRGGLYYVVPMCPGIAATTSVVPGTPPLVHLDLGKPVNGYALPIPSITPTYTLPGSPPSGSAIGLMHGGPQRTNTPTSARQEPRHDSYTSSSTGVFPHYDPQVNYSLHHDDGDNQEDHREMGWGVIFADEEDDEVESVSLTWSQIFQSRHKQCINCDTDKTSLWHEGKDGQTICNECQI
ncbi:hypothetical protein FRC10_003312 [Ceratobasidium sp. 414]|nr:hypothetical protein FRC10_003312 [Ceratobasidium sp. 414]